MTSLEASSAGFAQEIEDTVNAVLDGDGVRMVSRRIEDADRFVVQPAERQRIPIRVDGHYLAELVVALYLDLDRSRTYLKTVRSDLRLSSTLDKRPLLRLEYRADMHSDPVAHWQFHAERGAFSHLLARANAHRPDRVRMPHDLSSIHLPVGGERLRPCLEDFLHLLIADCGVDARPGWEAAIEAGRERWRRRQIRSAVRDVPEETAQVLRGLGWVCEPPEGAQPVENRLTLTVW